MLSTSTSADLVSAVVRHFSKTFVRAMSNREESHTGLAVSAGS